MRPSLRFLALAVIGWSGVSAASLGMLPGAEMFQISRSEAKPPPIVPTQFPEIEPLPPTQLASVEPILMSATAPQAANSPRTAAPQFYQAAISTPAIDHLMPTPVRFYAPVQALDQWPLSRIASASFPQHHQSIVVAPAESLPTMFAKPRLDRLQLTAWAMLRSQQTGVAGTPSLASGGTLGASQAGSRLAYNFTRPVSATLRTTSEVGRRGGEIAAGIRIQPARAIPLWVTAERRQRLGGSGNGRNAFAIFFESGISNRPLPWQFAMDAYLQGGVIGHDGFLDGGMAVTRPIIRRVSAGFGLWGGMQPGVSRLDVGPRISLKVRDNVRVHFDWRQRVAGNARPGSGGAVTLAGDF